MKTLTSPKTNSPLFIFHTLFIAYLGTATASFIEDTCKQATLISDDYIYCVRELALLRSIPSYHIPDANGLAFDAAQLTYNHYLNTTLKIEELSRNPGLPPWVKKGLSTCHDLYVNAISHIKIALLAFENSNPYQAMFQFQTVIEAPGACRNGVFRYPERRMLARENRKAERLSRLSLLMLNLLYKRSLSLPPPA
ncbi:hypothetical protein LUZ63_000267 [Rhynchospora breviuscula]|uniref:Pectinesterase inhibitor domain-containing protein n=1 Tax=Rhynchospora breviuscula TaxID=2022672 RepID=A0A9Q0CV10_9POAL|nr:hypothetical protein LUZ63_000267 [Rhynchospora breviuscula]